MPTVDVRIPGDLHASLLADIAGPREWAGYLLCGVHKDDDQYVLLGREWHPVPRDMAIPGSGHGFSWSSDFDVRMLNRAQGESLACVVLHYHGGSAPRLGHTSDAETARSLMPFLSREVPGLPHVFGVLGDGAASGIAYQNGAEVGVLGSYRVSSHRLEDWLSSPVADVPGPSETRHDRLVRGFGDGAHRRLCKTSVAVVGCGGGGSHVVQQLAYLGVGRIVIIDPDLVEETNLNRLIGAVGASPSRSLLQRLLRRGAGDVGKPKVSVMHRMVRAIDPWVAVGVLPEAFPTTRTVQALRDVDVIIACVDRLQVRDDLNRLCKRYLIPMVDIGIEIARGREDRPGTYAIPGRVTKVLADGPCLRCQGIVTDERLAEERGGRPLGYTGDLRVPDPAVVTLNGVVASLAATEVLQLVTGFGGDGPPNCGWIFDGVRGSVEPVTKTYAPGRPCEADRGRGDV